jgi:hypothetical protein
MGENSCALTYGASRLVSDFNLRMSDHNLLPAWNSRWGDACFRFRGLAATVALVAVP